MLCGPAANKFGEFVVKNIWDESVEFFDLMARGHWRSPRLKAIQKDLQSLSPDQLRIARQVALLTVGAGLHRFLFALHEADDFDQGVSVIVDGVNVIEQSDGLHGETFGPDGWMAKYSRFPEGYPTYE